MGRLPAAPGLSKTTTSANCSSMAGRLPPWHRWAGAGRVIHIGTFSKTISPALRLGFVVAPAELINLFSEVAATLAPAPTPIIQLATAQFMRDGHYIRRIRRLKRLYPRSVKRCASNCVSAMLRGARRAWRYCSGSRTERPTPRSPGRARTSAWRPRRYRSGSPRHPQGVGPPARGCNRTRSRGQRIMLSSVRDHRPVLPASHGPRPTPEAGKPRHPARQDRLSRN